MEYTTQSHIPDVENARNILLTQGYTCVICQKDTVYTTNLRGVKPLVQWLESGTKLHGFSAADKVVGKATAFLYCLLQVKEVFAQVMSKSAMAILQSHGITASCDTPVEHIINRKGDGICPFEATVMDITDPEAARVAILAKMEEMGIR